MGAMCIDRAAKGPVGHYAISVLYLPNNSIDVITFKTRLDQVINGSNAVFFRLVSQYGITLLLFDPLS